MINIYALYKGKEGTLWKDVFFVKQGRKEELLADFTGREGDYILWWLLDLDKLPKDFNPNDFEQLFVKEFSRDLLNPNYEADFVAGFYDDIAKERAWGVLSE